MTGSIETLRGGLVVSCQAPPGHPLRESPVIARLAQCAAIGGARGVRVNGPADIRAVKRVVSLPVIGLYKVAAGDRDLITPRFALAEELAEAGADVIAFEATNRIEIPPEKMISRIHEQLGLPVMADVATPAQGREAWSTGADLVASTLSGYTPDSPPGPAPDLDLVGLLAQAGVRTVAEGRLTTGDQVRTAFIRGAYAVVVGNAITDPAAITRRLVAVTPGGADPAVAG